MCNFIILSILLNLIISLIGVQADCGLNELSYDAASAPTCDANCQDLQRPCLLTTERAVAGCYCRPGYARNLQHACIPIAQCATDCSSNERPILPQNLGCEFSCGATHLRRKTCHSVDERKCICAPLHCRKSTGECVRGTRPYRRV